MEERLKNLVLSIYGVSINSDTKLSALIEDSLTAIEFLFEVEKEFNVSIPHEEILEMETFNDLIEVLKNKTN